EKTMIRLATPIMLAAMPTQVSAWAARVSSRSWPTGRSSGVAGAEGWERNAGSCTMGFTMGNCLLPSPRQAAELFLVQNGDLPPAEGDDALLGEVFQHLGDHLPGAADVPGHLLVGEGEDRPLAGVLVPEEDGRPPVHAHKEDL